MRRSLFLPWQSLFRSLPRWSSLCRLRRVGQHRRHNFFPRRGARQHRHGCNDAAVLRVAPDRNDGGIVGGLALGHLNCWSAAERFASSGDAAGVELASVRFPGTLYSWQLLLAPQVAYKLFAFYEGPAWRLLLFPPMWFVGLYEQILGAPRWTYHGWANWSRIALVSSAALSVVFYLASYFRHFSRTGETAKAGVAPQRTWRLLPLPKDPREAAVVDFVKEKLSPGAVCTVLCCGSFSVSGVLSSCSN